jgi:hypothetical protein
VSTKFGGGGAERKRLLRKSWPILEDNIKIDLKETEWEVVDWVMCFRIWIFGGLWRTL